MLFHNTVFQKWLKLKTTKNQQHADATRAGVACSTAAEPSHVDGRTLHCGAPVEAGETPKPCLTFLRGWSSRGEGVSMSIRGRKVYTVQPTASSTGWQRDMQWRQRFLMLCGTGYCAGEKWAANKWVRQFPLRSSDRFDYVVAAG